MRIKRTLHTVIATLIALSLVSVADAAKGNVRVAVLYFDNNTGDRDFELLKKGMADMLITDLSQVSGVTVVERDKLQSILGELKLQRSRFIDKTTAVRLGKVLGASHAITGSFTALKSQVRIDVRLLKVATGQVLHAEKVRGKKANFFELQQKLVTKFSCALNRAACGAGPAGASDPGVSTIIQYAKGLDQADRGDLKGASRTIKGVVQASPKFAPAKATYRRILSRLYASKTRRTEVLANAHARLVGRIAAVRRTDQLGRIRGGEDDLIGRWIGYRVLKGQLALRDIHVYFTALAAKNRSMKKSDDKQFERLVRAYYDNQIDLINAIDQFRKYNPGREIPDGALSDSDTKAAEELGLGSEPGLLSFLSTQRLTKDLATFVVRGKTPFWGTYRFPSNPLYSSERFDKRVEHYPPVHRLHSRFGTKAIALFNDSIKRVSHDYDRDDQQDQMIQTLDAYAKSLFLLGKPEQAIAQWQNILDRYPAFIEHAWIEKRIRIMLTGKYPFDVSPAAR